MLFRSASGTSYEILSEAKIAAFKKVSESEAIGKRFAGQLKAYRAAPGIFILEQQMSALNKSLKNNRKYLVMTDENSKQVTVIDLKNKLDASGLMDVGEVLQGNIGQ